MEAPLPRRAVHESSVEKQRDEREQPHQAGGPQVTSLTFWRRILSLSRNSLVVVFSYESHGGQTWIQ